MRFAETGLGDVKRLSGRSGQWRLRVGDWRVLFTYEEEDGEAIVVLRALHRREAYRS